MTEDAKTPATITGQTAIDEQSVLPVAQPVARRHALRALLAGTLGAVAAVLVGASRPTETEATTGSIQYTSTNSPATIEGDNTGGNIGVYGTSSGGSGSGIGVEGFGNTGVSGVGAVGVQGVSFFGAAQGVLGQTDNSTLGGVEGDNTGAGPGVFGKNTGGGGDGVSGTTDSNSGYGVKGANTGSFGTGIYGTGVMGVFGNGAWGVQGQGYNTGVSGYAATSGNGGSGVAGYGFGNPSTGVYGSGGGGIGVYGNGENNIGVYGTSSSSSNNSPGVWGQNTGGGPAIVGFASSGDGFSAVTATGTGCFGGASGSGTGVHAYSGTGTALSAQAPGSGAYAGFFSGSVFITGSLTVLGAKSAAVKAADGSLRRLYSLESPESWFEDFGSGQLNGGTATIQLEPDFAALVHSDGYHVFPVPEGDCKGLYASQKTANSFTVRECQGGTSNVPFDYRIVAKRKDISGARLEHVDEPPTPEVPAFPTPPTPPPTPAIPPGHGLEH